MTHRFTGAFLLLLGLFALMPQEAGAIPAWSRKEGVGCAYCHYRFNRLNQAGLDYYRRGFRTEARPMDAKQDLKADLGNYFSVLGRIDVNKRDHRDYTTAVKATLYGGGEVSPHWSFLAETTLNPPDSQEIADLFLGYSVGKEEKYVFLRAGQLLPLITVDNPFEVAADRDPAFPRDRHVGLAAGYNWKKLWGEVLVTQPATGADATSRNKVDFIANGQYVFTSNGSSLGGYAWEGNVNVSPQLSDPYKRYGLVANFNELAKGKLLLAAGWGTGKGDSAAAGSTKTNGAWGQVEYVFSDKFSALVHVVRADPNNAVADDDRTVYTTSAYYWPSDSVSIIGQMIAVNQFSSTNKQFRLRVQFMY